MSPGLSLHWKKKKGEGRGKKRRGGQLFTVNLKRYYGNFDYDIRHSLNGW